MLELVVGLEGKPGEILDMALQRAHPALFGDHDRDRLALDEGLLDGGKIMLGRIGELRAALAERRLRPEDVADLSDLLADLGPLLGFRTEQALDALQFARGGSCSSVLISISSSLRKERRRMLRMASAWTSVSLNALISAGFGSSSVRMILITLSMFR